MRSVESDDMPLEDKVETLEELESIKNLKIKINKNDPASKRQSLTPKELGSKSIKLSREHELI